MEFDFTFPTKGDSAVLAAIVSNGKGLLVRSFDPTKPLRNPLWKFAGGRVDWHKGESVYAGLVREVEEETGFIIPHLQMKGRGFTIGNAGVRVSHLSSSNITSKGVTHAQHRFLIEVKDERDILFLDRQTRKEDEDETIETRIFEFDEILQLPDFLWWQNEMRTEAHKRLLTIAA